MAPNDDDDEEAMIFSLLSSSLQQQSHTLNLLAHSSILTKTYHRSNVDLQEPDAFETITGPGNGNTLVNMQKVTYVRPSRTDIYHYVRNLEPDISLFTKITHLSRDEFDELHELVVSEIDKPFDVRHMFQPSENENRVSRKRKLATQEMLFLFFDILGGSNEGSVGLEQVALKYGVSVGTVSNYFRHVLFSLHKSLDDISPRLIRWPDEAERQSMEGLLIGFPSCFFFVDGNKTRRWRPGNNEEQEGAYGGYKKSHCWAILVFCDLYGRFIRLEITDHGAKSDRALYTNSDVYRNSELYLSGDQHGMADMGFAGDGALVVPYKRNESTSRMYRTQHNRDIRGQRMVNEWV